MKQSAFESIMFLQWLGLLPLLVSFLSGCAASSLMMGEREPDLSTINAGDTRKQAEKILGKRVWRAGQADGLTYDIYQYDLARPSEPGWAAFAVFADFATLGAVEVMYKDARNRAPVKQVAVAYDEQDRVRSVSSPWQISGGTADPCRRMRNELPSDSGVPASARPSPDDRPADVPSDIAVLELLTQVRAFIDGNETKERVVKLTPGRHTLNVQTVLGGSVMYGAALLPYDIYAELELLPGRSYRMKHDRYYGWPRQRADLFWIEDIHSRETLHCSWG